MKACNQFVVASPSHKILKTNACCLVRFLLSAISALVYKRMGDEMPVRSIPT